MKQYYTPSIEDIRVGYECERYSGYGSHVTNDRSHEDWWKPFQIKETDYYSHVEGGCEMDDIFGDLKNNRLRTPYLTKEQIENEGWVVVNDEGENYILFAKKDWSLTFWEYDGTSVRIEIYFGDFETDVPENFKGDCPSINELRKIVKLVTDNTNFPI